MAGKSVEYQVAGAVARLNSDMAAVVQRGASLALERSRRNSVTLWGFARGEFTYELWPGGHAVGVTLQWKSGRGDGSVRAVGKWRSGAAFLRACDGLVGVAECVARVIDAVTREVAADRPPTRAATPEERMKMMCERCGKAVVEWPFALCSSCLDKAYPNGVRHIASRDDPPMGYGYRQLHNDRSLWALRWGQSGRITGAVPVLEGERSSIVEHCEASLGESVFSAVEGSTVLWARAQRWDMVTP